MNEPTIRVLQPGDEAALEAFLLPRIDSSMFLVGNMRAAGLDDNGERYQGTYAAAYADGEIAGVVAHYWNGNLICQAPVHLDRLWRVAAQTLNRAIKGIIGPAAQVEAVKQALAVDDTNVQLDETEGLYALLLADLVEPEALRTGAVMGRRMESQDLATVTAWRVAYSIEALGEKEETPELQDHCRASLEHSLQEGTTWVLEAQGERVACSSFNTRLAEAVQIGGVWTPPAWRGRGYGRAVVAASLRDARAEGVTKAILFTGDANTPAQKAYLAVGFRRIGDYRILLLRTPLSIYV